MQFANFQIPTNLLGTILGFGLASCWGQVGISWALEAILGPFWESLGGDLGQYWSALGGVVRPGAHLNQGTRHRSSRTCSLG